MILSIQSSNGYDQKHVHSILPAYVCEYSCNVCKRNKTKKNYHCDISILIFFSIKMLLFNVEVLHLAKWIIFIQIQKVSSKCIYIYRSYEMGIWFDSA